MRRMLEPARTVIEICGGVEAVAEALGRDQTRVRRYAYPKDRGGSDGIIPAAHQPVLLVKFRDRGLRPEHFFPKEAGGVSC